MMKRLRQIKTSIFLGALATIGVSALSETVHAVVCEGAGTDCTYYFDGKAYHYKVIS